MRHVGIAAIVAVVLVMVLAGLAAANAVGWPEGFFATGVQVEAFEDGSGRATNAAGQLLFFCVQGYPCDHSIETDTAIYLPLVSK